MSVFACLDEEKMNHISNDAENCVREDYWNSSNPSMVSFVGLESNNQKQFWGWETNPNPVTPSTTSHANPFINPTTSIFDCNTLSSSSSTFAGNPIPYFQFSDSASTCFLKKEDDTYGIDGGNYAAGVRIGLNLGHRTYFSSRDTAVIDRLFRRPRGFYQTNQVPRCQAESCGIDLSYAKHYHRRHKVCEFHSKAIKVVAGGLEQRFCQQCSRFHVLAEFDEAKRSCRKRLADHNRRRRKPQLSSSDSVPTKIAENGVSVPVRTVENAFSQMGSSVPVSELKVTSLPSSTLPLMTAKSTIDNMASTHTTDSTCVEGTVTTLFANGPALSLGGEQHQITATHHRPIIFNNTMALFQRQNSVSAYHNLMISSSNDASLSAAGGSDQTQHPEHLQNLLHLGQAMFEVELL